MGMVVSGFRGEFGASHSGKGKAPAEIESDYKSNEEAEPLSRKPREFIVGGYRSSGDLLTS
jgi:hypothetical protein